MTEKNIDQKILKVLKAQPGRVFRQRELAGRLGIRQSELSKLKVALRKLVAEEEIITVKHGRYMVPKQPKSTEGRLIVNQKGFGFVVTGKDQPDIFIGRRQMSNAVNGDKVRVRIHGHETGSTRGTISRVISRGTNRFVGTVYSENRGNWLAVQPLTPIRGIKIITTQSIDFKVGQSVVAEVKDWGGTVSPIAVAIVEIIGDAGDPVNDFKIILNRYGYKSDFPSAVRNEAESFSTASIMREIKQRRDLRTLTTFTIDPVSARDFDDALSIEKKPAGYQLGVHIADVSHFVRPGAAIDREALNRGTSVYFTEGTVHMLPESLAADLCSLKPNCDRLTMSALIDLDDDYNVTGFNVMPTVINSNFRFTYRQVQDVLDGKQTQALKIELNLLLDLSRILNTRRADRGSIDFDIPESIFTLSPEGIPHTITPSERLDSHRIVEECMLLANRLVAEKIPQANRETRPFIYRIHDQPDKSDMLGLIELLRLLQIYSGPATSNLSSLELRDILASVAGSRYKNLVENITLRTMTKAIYAPENRGHFGLAFKHYTHFTSPIRRYPDLLVHRLIKQYLGYSDSYSRDNLIASIRSIADLSTDAELKALPAEREYIKIKQLRWLIKHLGETFTGMISGVTQFGFFVELADTLVEGLVHIDTLSSDDFSYDPAHYCLRGRQFRHEYQLGNTVRIVVQDVLLDKMRANFVLAE